MKLAKALYILAFLVTTSCLFGQGERVHTKVLPEGSSSPAASIEDVAWIEGHWLGEAFGGIAEEIWSTPAAGTMMASFRLIDGEDIAFYEFIIIREVDSTLTMQLKHFDNALRGWEEKEESVEFPLVALTEDAAYFEGLTFIKNGPDEMTVIVLISKEDGINEVTFAYKRKES